LKATPVKLRKVVFAGRSVARDSICDAFANSPLLLLTFE
jgi:hypothetical protein